MAQIKHRYTGKKYLEAASFKFKHKDYFNLKYLYELMHEWFIEEGYAPREDPLFPETFYMHRETQTIGNEIWIYWRMTKKPIKDSKFWKYDLDMDMHVVGLKDAELMHEGQKYKAQWGEPEIKIWAKLVFDYEGWSKSKLLAPLFEVFQKRIVKKTMEAHKKELYREAYRFQESMKSYFKLSTHLPEREMQAFYETKTPGEQTKP